MIRSTWLVCTAASAVLGLAVASAEAAPATGAPIGYKAVVGESSAVESAHWGRRRYGGYPYYYYGYHGYPYWRYYSRPRYYHYGYSPGFRFYYGAPRHRYWRHW